MADYAKLTTDSGQQANMLEEMLHIKIGGKDVLVRSSQIKEVVRPTALTPAPMGPDHIIGLANIHGQIICIIDAGGITSLPASNRQASARTRFLVLRHPEMHVGIWADEVCKISRVDRAVIDQMDDSVVQIDVENRSFDILECSMLLH
ncbi:MAG: chemotaxis protein CheW [Mariprofundus sp.]